MGKTIEDLLQRRGDLSTFLIHLTRRTTHSARNNLLRILSEQALEARTALGLAAGARRRDESLWESQRVVCFTETPLEHMWMHCEEIERRSIQFAPYGVVFTKSWARRMGVNPVWYIDITRGHDWLTNPLNDMVEIALRGRALALDGGAVVGVEAVDSPIARVAPFIEQMGNPAGVRKEFWWEREWRHVGDLSFGYASLVAVVVPEDDQEDFLYDLEEEAQRRITGLRLLDPRWGLERMIAALARVPTRDVGPFPE